MQHSARSYLVNSFAMWLQNNVWSRILSNKPRRMVPGVWQFHPVAPILYQTDPLRWPFSSSTYSGLGSSTPANASKVATWTSSGYPHRWREQERCYPLNPEKSSCCLMLWFKRGTWQLTLDAFCCLKSSCCALAEYRIDPTIFLTFDRTGLSSLSWGLLCHPKEH